MTRARRRGVPGRPGRRQGRHVRQLGGPRPAVRRGAADSAGALPDLRVLAGIAEELGRARWASAPSPRSRAEMTSSGRWDGDRAGCARRVTAGRRRRVDRRRSCSPPGSSCSTTAAMQDGDAATCGPPPARPSPGSPRRRSRRSASSDGDAVTVTGDRGSITLPVEVAPTCPTASCGCPANSPAGGVLADLASPGSTVTRDGRRS